MRSTACSATRIPSRAAPACSASTRSPRSPTRSRTCSPTPAGGELAPASIDVLLRAGDGLRALVNADAGADPRGRRADRRARSRGRAGGRATVARTARPHPRVEPEAETRRSGWYEARGHPRRGGVSARDRTPRREPEGSAARGRTVRVPVEKLDALLDLVGETVLHRQRLGHMVSSGDAAQHEQLSDELDLGDRLLGALQDVAIGTRTLPFGSITGPFARAIRDIANAEGKEVDLEIKGNRDRARPRDPRRALRAARAHAPERDRPRHRAAGRPPGGGQAGTRARRARRGAARRARRRRWSRTTGAASRRSCSRGLLREGSLVDILAGPGFSTRAIVSDLAGRGVGLDVVKAHVESVRRQHAGRQRAGRGHDRHAASAADAGAARRAARRAWAHVFGVPLASVQEAVLVTETLSLTGRQGARRTRQLDPVQRPRRAARRGRARRSRERAPAIVVTPPAAASRSPAIA